MEYLINFALFALFVGWVQWQRYATEKGGEELGVFKTITALFVLALFVSVFYTL